MVTRTTSGGPFGIKGVTSAPLFFSKIKTSTIKFFLGEKSGVVLKKKLPRSILLRYKLGMKRDLLTYKVGGNRCRQVLVRIRFFLCQSSVSMCWIL